MPYVVIEIPGDAYAFFRAALRQRVSGLQTLNISSPPGLYCEVSKELLAKLKKLPPDEVGHCDGRWILVGKNPYLVRRTLPKDVVWSRVMGA